MLLVSFFFFIAVVAGAVMFKLGRRQTKVADKSPTHHGDVALQHGQSRPVRKNLLQVIAELVPFRLYFSYYKRRFHPWDHDNSPLVEAWKRRYPDFGATPNP